MTDLMMNENRDQESGSRDDLHRRRRGRNIALAAVLCGFVVLVYIVTIVKISGS